MIKFSASFTALQVPSGTSSSNPLVSWHLSAWFAPVPKSSLHCAINMFTSDNCFSQSATVSMPYVSSQPSLPLKPVVTVDVADVVMVEVADEDAVDVCELVAVVVMDEVAVELTLEVTVLDNDVVADVVTVLDCVLLKDDVAVEVADVDAVLDWVEVALEDAVVVTVVVAEVRSHPCRSPAK